ncbi:hypothetical protein OG205_04685 [Lentzea sp. NBC_00516]|uniref:DUF6414 family protein n=1 Tax=Lentzea sp. NBC_00516 TaxID=2903582 RepID=UPI002E8037BA|nr:hypothetical protein [Lentzea sp. NBC_00516]WUD26310.1 hypothetical protein OG205_04685 [Lentzea sp. NBC_00516]
METDAIFQLSNILVTLKELTDESADLRAQLGSAELLEELIAINNLIEKMMVGLIPLKCRIVDYVAVDTEHGVKIVHQSIFDDLDTDSGYTAQPLYLVGDTQRDLYWKDIRRVLFTQSRFRVLCRLNVTGITTSWNPLKMGNSLRTVVPDLSSKLAAFGRTAVSAFSGTASPETHVHERRTAALDTYGKLVAEELHYSLNAEQVSQLSVLAHDNRHVFKSASTAPSAFNPIKQYVEQLAGATLSPEVHSRLRAAACHRQELLVDGTLSNPSSYTYPLQQEPSEENLIDAEIIAIYW